MDYQEAIEVLKSFYTLTCKMVDGRLKGGFKDYECDAGKAISVAVSAMQELQQYKQLGTLEEVREAVEKQKKKKPKGDLHSVPHYRCPNCNSTVKLYQNSKKDEICKWCGQRIEWSEVENER